MAEELVEVLDLADVDLRAGQKGLDAKEIDDDAALDAPHQAALDGVAGVVSILDQIPDPHEVGLLLGEHDLALLVFDVLQEDLNFLALLNGLGVGKFLDRHRAFGLEADIDHHFAGADGDDRALDDLALFDAGDALLVEGHEFVELVLIVLGLFQLFDADVAVHRSFLLCFYCFLRLCCYCGFFSHVAQILKKVKAKRALRLG